MPFQFTQSESELPQIVAISAWRQLACALEHMNGLGSQATYRVLMLHVTSRDDQGYQDTFGPNIYKC